MKRFFKKGDAIVVFVFLLVSALIMLPKFFSKDKNVTAKIYENGELMQEIDLTKVEEPYRINISGAVLLIENGRICYETASCPDKLCVKSDWLSKNGDVASCLPNKTVVSVSSSGENIDVISY